MTDLTRWIAALALAAFATPSLAQDVPPIEAYAEDVADLAATDLLDWIRDPVVIDAIREANVMHASMTQSQIDALDLEWRRQTKIDAKYMIYDLLDRQASIVLRDKRETSKGIITEIIVMDKWGLNAAISDPTSDYYQGDEAKYRDTYPLGKDAVHVSEVEYDESTQKFQTQVSLTVVDPTDGNTPIGAVTFGIDLSQLKPGA
ncbi:MAG: hypothetical protein AAGI34_01025 [Pseudomonadota bacterium]